MNQKITLLIIGLFSAFGFSQDKAFDLLKNKTQTNILYDRVSSVSNATQIKTSDISSNYFIQVFHEMQRADFLNRMPKLEVIKKQADLGFAHNQVPLSVLISDFETIKKEDFDNKNVFGNANNQFELKSNAANVFEKHSINLIAPLLSKVKTNSVEFFLNNNMIFNTTDRIISSISVKNEGDNNWKTITIGEPFTINFSKSGKQTIHFKINFTNGNSIEESSILTTDNQQFASTNRTATIVPNVVTPITATIPYQGYGETASYLGQGEYEIFPDTVNGIFDKPIILLDGFDPGDTRNVAGIYSLLNYGTTGQNLGDIVRAQGFDVVILNFPSYTRTGTTTVVDGGVDYIQRNAMILVELLNQINAQKVGTAKNVVIGPSMGGLISRYALRYMEQNSLNPDTRLYISFDSPHLGANVPIGFQHLFNYMGFGPLQDTGMQALVNGMLKSPAAREMLIDHFEGHLQSGSAYEFNTTPASALLPKGCPNYRTAFQGELNTMGFPTTTRNVSIANGAGNGTMTGTPGMEVMNHTFNTSSTQRAIINLHFTPDTNTQNEVSHFKGQQWILFWITGYESLANSKAPTYTAGLDSAPGGRFDMSSLAALGSGNALMTEFMDNLQIMYFDFIPVWSSMSISGTNNLYAPVTSTSTTPFVASSIPTTNENHVTLTDTNVAFALSEILQPLSTQQNTFLDSIWIANPVRNSIQINASYPIENVTISVVDVLGKVVYSIDDQNINGGLEIPVSLQNGVYLVTIKNDNGNVVKKIVKE